VDKNLYIIYVIMLVIGCIGVLSSIILGIYIYIKEDLNEYINFDFLSDFNIKKRFVDHKKLCIKSKSSQLSIQDEKLVDDDTTLLNDDTTLLNDEKIKSK
jgi:hypothetical protein